MMGIILNIAVIVLLLLGVFTIYLLVFAIAGRLKNTKTTTRKPEKMRRFAVFLPSYKEDKVILESARTALIQDYPAALYDVIVIADSLKPETVAKLRELPINTIEVTFDVSTKAKALNYAIGQIANNYDVALILDADNIMASDFITKINATFDLGYQVVQGHRTAKNTNSPTAILDAISEEINNHILRKGHRALGLSSALIGSGMAFEYQLFRNVMLEIHAIGGFDKELEMRLLKQGVTFDYIDDAIVYDEKVQNAEVFEKQRTRWIAAQFKYLKQNFASGIIYLFKGNIDYANKVFQALLPPRIILLGMLMFFSFVSLFSGDKAFMQLAIGQLFLLIFTFYISTPDFLKKLITWKEISLLPSLFFRFIRAILKMGEAKKKFLHTPHDS
ncbi:glycosyltransferase [Flectobacillus major]|uniref:glycosyltransferase n=1 Tax=Flectobacillus major TaxID=103 RepID=UPI0004180EAF|nr:glycosyltransferase family 2 protein [Flectobacillus major]